MSPADAEALIAALDETCPKCHGAGRVYERPCPECRGRGHVLTNAGRLLLSFFDRYHDLIDR